MKKLFLIFSFAISSIAVQAQSNAENKESQKDTVAIDYHQLGTPLPSLRVVTMDTLPEYNETNYLRRRPTKGGQLTRAITEKDYKKKGNLLIMTFNPTCGHCEEQTEQFIKNLKSFKNAHILLVSNPIMKDYLPDFIHNHHLKEHPQMQIGVDSAEYINKTYLYGALPQINIYSHDRKLLRIFNGEVSMDTLLKYID